MPLISKCPKCRQQVTIPDRIDPDAEVRCPFCAVVYPLSEAMAEAPPALIPVDSGAIPGSGPESDAASEPAETEAQAPAGEGPTLDVWRKVDEAPQIDTGAVDDGSPAIDTGQTPVDADALATFDVKESEDEYQPVDGSPSKRRRKRKKHKSAVRFMMEVFLGGLVGLTIGYYVLCWVWGPQHGLPELPLPFLPHTMHWWADLQKPDNGPEQPATEEPHLPKRQPEPQPQPTGPPASENDALDPEIPPAEPPVRQPE